MALAGPEEARAGRDRLHSLDLLRAAASLLVFYVHLSTWFRYHGGPTSVTTWLDRWVVGPTHLNRDLGFLGVALFFLVSGFVISHVATRETVAEFSLKRLSRIFPALAAAVGVAWALVASGALGIPGDASDIGGDDVLANMTLANFFREPFVPLVGVAWTLIIQLAVYVMIAAMLPLLRSEPWLVIAIEVTVCAVVLSVVRNFSGLAASSIANIGAFGTVVVLGQVVWAVWARRVPLWAGAGLGLGCWVVFLWGDHLGYGRYDDSYPLTLAIALPLVVAALLADDRIRRNPVVAYLATRSYSTYLLHQTVAFSVLAAVTPLWGRWVAAATAVATTFVAVELVHRLVERPGGRLGAELVRRARDARDRRRQPPVRPAGRSEDGLLRVGQG